MNVKNLFFYAVIAAVILTSSVAMASDGATFQSAVAGALGNGFTYQGYLTDSNGVPYNGACDMDFRLFDALAGGVQHGAADFKTVTVVDGRFTVILNRLNEFGTAVFRGDERFLQIKVRCSGEAEYITLAPRQPITAVPYAVFALNIPTHNHVSQTWVKTAGSGPVLTLDNQSASGPGLTVKGVGSEGLHVIGSVSTTAESKYFVNAQSMVLRRGTGDVTTGIDILPFPGGVIKVLVVERETRFLIVPLQLNSLQMGRQTYLSSMRLCYRTGPYMKIATTAVAKWSGYDQGETYYILDTTELTSAVTSCRTFNAAKPRLPVDNNSWVQFNITNSNPDGTATSFFVYSIEITLSQSAND